MILVPAFSCFSSRQFDPSDVCLGLRIRMAPQTQKLLDPNSDSCAKNCILISIRSNLIFQLFYFSQAKDLTFLSKRLKIIRELKKIFHKFLAEWVILSLGSGFTDFGKCLIRRGTVSNEYGSQPLCREMLAVNVNGIGSFESFSQHRDVGMEVQSEHFKI